MSNPIDLDAIEKRANAATPGPWVDLWQSVADTPSDEQRVIESTASGLEGLDRLIVGVVWHDGPNAACHEQDAAFIAAARSDVPALVNAVRDRDAEIARLKAERDATRGYADADPIRWAETWPGEHNAYRGKTNVATINIAPLAKRDRRWQWFLRPDSQFNGKAAELDDAKRAVEKSLDNKASQ